MKFAVRVDDFGWIETGVIDRGLRLAREFHSAMNGLPYLAGVIPGTLDDEGREWLRSNPQGLTVAMHGCTHQRSRDGLDSEFEELDYEDCLSRLLRGKKLLGMPSEHFVSPWNSYTPELVKALVDTGFVNLWKGLASEPTRPYWVNGHRVVWSWEPLYASTLWRMFDGDVPINKLLPRIKGIRSRSLITLHITWEAAHGRDFKGIRWLASEISDSILSPDEYIAGPELHDAVL